MVGRTIEQLLHSSFHGSDFRREHFISQWPTNPLGCDSWGERGDGTANELVNRIVPAEGTLDGQVYIFSYRVGRVVAGSVFAPVAWGVGVLRGDTVFCILLVLPNCLWG